MNIRELQTWINKHNPNANLKVDGIAGVLTRTTFIQTFANKSIKKITEDELLKIAKELGDTSTIRIKTIARVESGLSCFFENGLPKILYERHIFYRLIKRVISVSTFGLISDLKPGGYTTDIDKNRISDSWDRLSFAVCENPDAALQSISIGKFQVLGKYYKELGYSHPIEMLWSASQSELAHYDMLKGYILKIANLTSAFLSIDENPNKCRAFAKGYNGPNYKKNDYHNKLASSFMLEEYSKPSIALQSDFAYSSKTT